MEIEENCVGAEETMFKSVCKMIKYGKKDSKIKFLKKWFIIL